MSRWADAASWTGDGIRRESFFFDSRGTRLFGSLYAAEPTSTDLGLVLCSSWAFEGNLGENLMHGVAIDAMEAGGTGMTFHYPGFGDSEGDLAAVDLEALADAAVDAVATASQRAGGRTWTLAGFALGASVACLAASRCETVSGLLLLQPSLLPSSYFERLQRSARRAARRDGTEGIVHGYPLPPSMTESATAGDAAVAAALAAFDGELAVVRYEEPDLPDGLAPDEEIEIEGSWHFGTRDTSGLRGAAARWIRDRAGRDDATLAR